MASCIWHPEHGESASTCLSNHSCHSACLISILNDSSAAECANQPVESLLHSQAAYGVSLQCNYCVGPSSCKSSSLAVLLAKATTRHAFRPSNLLGCSVLLHITSCWEHQTMTNGNTCAKSPARPSVQAIFARLSS